MKKYYLIALILFGFCFGFIQQEHIAVIGKKSDVTACVITNITFWWRAEALNFSGTNGTSDYSAGDDIAEVVSAAAINADAAKMGTNGMDSPTASDVFVFNDGTITDVIDDSEGRIGIWLRITTWSDDQKIFRLYDNDSNIFLIGLTASDELTWLWEDGGTVRTALTTSTSPLPSTGTWYFVEWAWKTSTNYREFFVDGVSIASSSETIGQFAGDPIEWRWGTTQDGTADLHFDNPIISSVSTDDLAACKDETEWPE